MLARAWRRRTYASLGMTVIVPVGLVASVAVLALTGGIPGLGALAQAVSGPSAPALAPPALGGSAAVSGAAGLLPALARGGTPGRKSPVALAAGGGAAAATVGGSLRRGAPSRPGGATGRSGNLGGGSGGYPGSSGRSGKPPSPHPTVVDRVVGTVTPVTSSLPAPVGPALTQTLSAGGAVADRILHHLPGQ